MRFIVFFLATGLCVAQTAAEWLSRGIQAFKSAHYPEAVSAFRKAVELNPSNRTAHLYLGTAYMQQYVPGAIEAENQAMAQSAITEFQQVLSLDPGNRVALASLASLKLNMRRFDEARESYRQLLVADPANKDAYYSLGFIAWSQFYPAYAAARQKLGMKPQDPGPLADPAARTEMRSRWWQVIEDGIWNLNRALELDPQYDDAMAYMNLLIRERADLRDSPADYQRDISVADGWVEKVLATKREKAQRRVVEQHQATAVPLPPPPPSGEPRVRVSASAAEQSLLSRARTIYPPLAKQARIQGTVRLSAIIGKDGSVVNLGVISGHPLLVPAALESVKQWKYRPTLLNGQAVEIATQVDVVFEIR